MISFECFPLEEGIPIYLQIIRHVKRGIVAGIVRDGDELPSRRVLSARLGVNPNTVQKAYRLLEEEGIALTFTTESHSNRLTSGDPSCLRRMGRYNVTESMAGQALKRLLEDAL